MTDYRIVYEDPEAPDEPAVVVVPSENWVKKAMAGEMPPVHAYWAIQDEEQKAIDEGRHDTFMNSPEVFNAQFLLPRTGPLTEQQAIEYLVMKDVPRRVWGRKHNRTMLRIVHKDKMPKHKEFRNAWEVKQ